MPDPFLPDRSSTKPAPADRSADAPPTDASIKDFEAAIAELDGIVKRLEEGDLSLEQSLVLYERGVQLSRFCHSRLEDAERRIDLLTDRGELKPAPASLTPDEIDRP